jgi:hypothetical protein
VVLLDRLGQKAWQRRYVIDYDSRWSSRRLWLWCLLILLCHSVLTYRCLCRDESVCAFLHVLLLLLVCIAH